jgi:hypothetical protein
MILSTLMTLGNNMNNVKSRVHIWKTSIENKSLNQSSNENYNFMPKTNLLESKSPIIIIIIIIIN